MDAASMTPQQPSIRHHFTVDVEESFQVVALEPFVDRRAWDDMPQRVDRGVNQILEILAEHGATATFFVLSWVAERQPALVRAIAAAGHEIASHGTDHKRVTQLVAPDFRASVRSSKTILEDISGQQCLGYRAPSFSIVRGREWALDVLIEEGYAYDSSLFPVRRNGYGFVGGRRDPYRIDRPAGSIQEIPPATLKFGPAVMPAAGGAYLRHLPYGLVESAVRAAERRSAPATLYIHPWELDVDQPQFPVPPITRLRHYGRLARTAPRLRRLLATFQFQSIERSLAGDLVNGFGERRGPPVRVTARSATPA
jgi:polysaccharide deacetylase family protein (PEP-CTERM system associated)